MSLNAAEIDRILEELDLGDGFVQKVLQPDFRNLYLAVYRHGVVRWIRICLENPGVRLHAVARPPRAKRSHQRFESFLHSRISGARIESVEHVHRDRIVRLDLARTAESISLYVRLWGTRANVIVTERDGTILDACFRKPGEGIESGGTFRPEPPARRPAEKPIRPVEEGRSLNEQVDAEYRAAELERDRIRLESRARRILQRQRGRLVARLGELAGSDGDAGNADQLRHTADLIMANLHRAAGADRWLDVEDYGDDNRSVRIELYPDLGALETAQRLYERSRRAAESAGELRQMRDNLERRLVETDEQLADLESASIEELREITTTVGDGRPGAAAGQQVGLRFSSGGFQIIVGRNARENDHLLRHEVRGNDWWLHTRDAPGGYVFIRSAKGKSVPLDVLLDAGNLALHFSRLRASGRADLFYTQVKYLRRAKHGTLGLVIPTQERNLAVTLEPERLARLGIGVSPGAT